MLILIALLLSLGWLALGLHYLITFVGLESFAFLPPYEVGLIAVGLFGPVALVWCIVATLRSPGRARRLEQQVQVLVEQVALLRQDAGGEAKAAPVADAAKTNGSSASSSASSVGATKAATTATTKTAEPSLNLSAPTTESAADANRQKASSSEANETAAQPSANKAEAPKDLVAAARRENDDAKQPTPRTSPLTDGLPPFKAGKDEPKDGELIYDILRRSVRDHLNDTAMDIAAVLSAREAYSEALTKLRQGGRGAFFELVAKDLAEGGESARARLDRLNAWPMLDSYGEDYERLIKAAGGKETKLGALIESSEVGQLGGAVSAFVDKAKPGQDKSAPPAGDSAKAESATNDKAQSKG